MWLPVLTSIHGDGAEKVWCLRSGCFLSSERFYRFASLKLISSWTAGKWTLQSGNSSEMKNLGKNGFHEITKNTRVFAKCHPSLSSLNNGTSNNIILKIMKHFFSPFFLIYSHSRPVWPCLWIWVSNRYLLSADNVAFPDGPLVSIKEGIPEFLTLTFPILSISAWSPQSCALSQCECFKLPKIYRLVMKLFIETLSGQRSRHTHNRCQENVQNWYTSAFKLHFFAPRHVICYQRFFGCWGTLIYSASSLSLVYRKGCGISCEVKLTKNPPSSTDRLDLGK